MICNATAALALVLAAAPASAATDVALARFEALSLHGGGKVTVRHGARQQVRIVSGDPAVSSLQVINKSLKIRVCRDSCPDGYRLEVEIVSPDLDALAVRGGGRITMVGFPPKSALALSVERGGKIDTRSVQANRVAAAVEYGGTIQTWATGSLAASVRGGGGITYRGDPTVATTVRAGGSVRAE